MNTTFKWITTVLLFILIAFLLWVVISYYRQPNIPADIDNNFIDENIIKPDLNDDESIVSKDSIISEDNNKEDEEEVKTTDKVIPKTDENKGVIMSSGTETSDTEKQEVLSELDNTLMELLDVIDKVQTVDVTKIEDSDNESEVEQ